VKNNVRVNVGHQLEAEALQILRAVPDLEVDVAPPGSGPDDGADAVVAYGRSRTPMRVEFKQRVSSAQAHQLAASVMTFPDTPLLLIAGEATAAARETLASHGIGYVDGLGNMHLELPGLLMHLAGSGRPIAQRSPTRLSGKSSTVAQAMLLEPERAWHVSDLAERTNVSNGLVHRVLSRLEEEGVVTSTGSGPTRTRSVANPTALLDLWTEEHHDRQNRTRAYLLAPSAGALVSSLASSLDDTRIDYALTGAAAASLVVPFVTAVPVTELWISSRAWIQDVFDHTGATPVSEGPNVVFLQAKDDGPLAFHERRSGVSMANIFRIYIDLRRDPRRGIEQSDNLRREVIGF